MLPMPLLLSGCILLRGAATADEEDYVLPILLLGLTSCELQFCALLGKKKFGIFVDFAVLCENVEKLKYFERSKRMGI